LKIGRMVAEFIRADKQTTDRHDWVNRRFHRPCERA